MHQLQNAAQLLLHSFLMPRFVGLLQVLQKTLPTYDIGMFEQNAMVYLLMQNPHFMDKVYFEHSYCFNCWYKDLDSPLIIPPAFVIHFAGDTYRPLAQGRAMPSLTVFGDNVPQIWAMMLQLNSRTTPCGMQSGVAHEK